LARRQAFKGGHAICNEMERLTFCRERSPHGCRGSSKPFSSRTSSRRASSRWGWLSPMLHPSNSEAWSKAIRRAGPIPSSRSGSASR